jgi:hypothetical protein
MAEWLPPQAPGAKPPPRFDAQPPPPAVEADPAEPAAPSGWAPPRSTGGQVAASHTPAPAPAPAPAHAPPRPAPPAAAARPNTPAVWALIFGITGLALLLLSLGTLFLLTLPCSAAAWVLSRKAAARIERGETAHGGGQATAALWLGRIGVAAGVAAMVAFIVLTATGFDFEALRDDLERDLERRRESAR